MPSNFRIHGDNIVECERIADLIIHETKPNTIRYNLMAPSTISVDIMFSYSGCEYTWHLELLPGFNKSGRTRWEHDIFTVLRENGGFLDETPDAIITSVNGDDETILCAIEFCSALQAGNQAWQRSGRAYSTGRTGCPYLYIVDFVKFELDPNTRERKSLRFPNPAVPYSYINFSQESNNFVAQVYVRSEDFDAHAYPSLLDFNEEDFGSKELSTYIVKLMCGLNTSTEEHILLQKNLNIVLFLADKQKHTNNTFSRAQWQRLYTYANGIVKYSLDNANFNFQKRMKASSIHGKMAPFLKLVAQLSKGLASQTLPFGIIPQEKRPDFAKEISVLYPTYDKGILKKIAKATQPLLICIVKGFKPGGDDNRPDRGVLPLAHMLSGTNTEVFTYIYGPILDRNYNLLLNQPERLANSNGFWKSFLYLSDYLALDATVINNKDLSAVQELLDTTLLKKKFIFSKPAILKSKLFPSVACEYHEDDVDTGIHYLFSRLLGDHCFEGLCNPPGGDWSGISIVENGFEKRWLSLPRVSSTVAGKRPDHIYEIFGLFDNPILLTIESKEKSSDLEQNVGQGLINYIQHLMNYIPSVERPIHSSVDNWEKSACPVNFTSFEVISAAAYLSHSAQPPQTVYNNSSCDMLLIMSPHGNGWNIRIETNTPKAASLKSYIIKLVISSKDSSIHIE